MRSFILICLAITAVFGEPVKLDRVPPEDQIKLCDVWWSIEGGYRIGRDGTPNPLNLGRIEDKEVVWRNKVCPIKTIYKDGKSIAIQFDYNGHLTRLVMYYFSRTERNCEFQMEGSDTYYFKVGGNFGL